MKIALIGFGNMGQEVAQLLEKGNKHTIVSISFKIPSEKLDTNGIKKADVAIDFTAPQIVLQNMQAVLPLGTKMVIGTTGWYDNLSEVESLVKKTNGGLVYGQNFSVGANIFFHLTEYASRLIGQFEEYDVYGFEVHHTGKKDSPSGTAKKLSDIILKNVSIKKKVQTEKLDRQITPEELHFASLRGGRNPGYHEIVFDSTADSIRLSHQAHGRQGFAQGAIIAAEFIQGKKGIYSFDEIMKV